jgi:hypothetical protein
MWNGLKSLGLKQRTPKTIPSHLQNPDLINDYFINSSKMNEHHLQEEIEFYEKHKLQDFLKPFEHRSVSESEVQDVLQKIHSGAVGCDRISIHMFKMIPDLCLKSLTDIVNCSIETKVFPNVWNSYLCNKLGNSIFYRIRHGIFDRDDSRDQKLAVYGKKWISHVLHT